MAAQSHIQSIHPNGKKYTRDLSDTKMIINDEDNLDNNYIWL